MNRLLYAGRILLAMLREVFDEAAYARFLKSANMPSSRSAYAAFCRERESSRARAAKCC